jgi:hypothetical protein
MPTPLAHVGQAGGGLAVQRKRQIRSTPRAVMDNDKKTQLDKLVGRGIVRALPEFPEDTRTKRKDRAASSEQDAKRAWLRSPSGMSWFKQCRNRLHVGRHSD